MALEQALVRTWLGMTPNEFEAEVTKYLSYVKSERFGVPYNELIYKPMLEVFELLAANDFRIFVCTVGGREFMQVIAESAWGITREHVIGTTPSYEYKEGKVRRGDDLLGGPCIGTRQSGAHIRLRRNDAGFCGRQCRGGHRDARMLKVLDARSAR